MDKLFIKAVETKDKELLKKVPKSDLHNHSALGSNFEEYKKWLGKPLQSPPSKMKDLYDLDNYIFNVIGPSMFGVESIEYLINAAIKNAVSDGVVKLQMSFDSFFADFFSNGVEGYIAFMEKISKRYSEQINFIPQLGFARGNSENYYKTAEACIETGYFKAIDLYGQELAQDAKDFVPLFRKAKAKGMKLIAHTGEFGDAESIRYTAELLELEEIQHGISAATSPEVMKWLADNKIQLNICPTSNVILSRVESLPKHPIRKLFDNGIKVTINSDDLMIFGQTVSDEYLNLYNAGVFSAEELNAIRLCGLGK
jgi:adenosine deaminase